MGLPLFVGCVRGGRSTDPALDRLDYSEPMRYSSFNKRHWSRALEAASIPPIRFYDLHHTHASRCLDSGMTITEVQQRLGHGGAWMTLNRYRHSRNEEDDRARRGPASGHQRYADQQQAEWLSQRF